MDSLIDVLDVVMIVNYALGVYADSYQFWASDLNTDGIINVQDIVMEIDIIIGISNLTRIKHLEEAKINLFKDKITVSSEGTIAGIELHTSGDFTITSSTLSQGWEFYQNNDMKNNPYLVQIHHLFPLLVHQTFYGEINVYHMVPIPLPYTHLHLV